VQVTCAPGANDAAPAGHTGTGGVPLPVKALSSTVTLVRVTLPVLVTTNEYVIVWPGVNECGESGDADLTTVNAGVGGAVTVAESGGEVSGVLEPGGVPCAVAVFVIVPASTSACVTA
jgi:hypothetical protein